MAMKRRLLGLMGALLGVTFLSNASAAELEKISVGYVPVADFTPAFIAKDKGYFEQHGLDVTLVKIALASNVPGALVANSLDIGMGTPPMLLVTSESGLDLVAIAAVSRLTKDNPFVSLITRPAANIKEATDLKGKKLGVPGFNSAMDISIRKWLMDRNVAPTDVNFVEAVFPQMHDLLAGGTLDAVIALEPFRTLIIRDGTGVNVRDFYADLSPDALAAIWMAKADWIDHHHAAVDGFRAGLAQGIADLQKDPAEFKAVQLKWLGFASPSVPSFSLKVSKEDLAFFADMSKQVGILHQPPQLDKLIAP
jgi:NitT/TauT family transport system substrate-binding protein